MLLGKALLEWCRVVREHQHCIYVRNNGRYLFGWCTHCEATLTIIYNWGNTELLVMGSAYTKECANARKLASYDERPACGVPVR